MFNKAMSMNLLYLKSCNSWTVTLLLYHITLGMVLLKYKGHLVLPQSTDLKHVVFYELQASPSIGHSGFLKTYEWA